jgi:hypothetical protein
MSYTHLTPMERAKIEFFSHRDGATLRLPANWAGIA